MMQSSQGDEDKVLHCIYGGYLYSESKEGWVICIVCKAWVHNLCAGVDEKDKEVHTCECCLPDKIDYSFCPMAWNSDLINLDTISQKNIVSSLKTIIIKGKSIDVPFFSPIFILNRLVFKLWRFYSYVSRSASVFPTCLLSSVKFWSTLVRE